MRTRHLALLTAALGLLAGCDPFVASVDEPSACMTLTAQHFSASGDGAAANVPFDLSFGGKLAQSGADTHVELVSLELSSKDLPDFGFVTGARVQVLPGASQSTALGGVVAASGVAPHASGNALTIDGSGADVYPQLAGGAAALQIELQGAAPGAFDADVTACVHISASENYL